MLGVGDKVGLVFSTRYVGGLYPGVCGKVTELDGAEITRVLWDNGTEMEFVRDGAVDTRRVVSRAFVTKLQKGGRVIMQFLGDKAVPLPTPPKVGGRVEFLFSTVSFAGSGLYKGNCGTVNYIDGIGTIHVEWDNGAIAPLIPDWDHFRVLPENIRADTRGV